MVEIFDDKSEDCISFILEYLENKSSRAKERPLFVGVNGAQGSGKTTLVCTQIDWNFCSIVTSGTSGCEF